MTRLRNIAESDSENVRLATIWKNSFAGGLPVFEKIVDHLPLPASKNLEWLQFKLGCPVSSGHEVQEWNDPGRCPVCGSFLEKAGVPFRVWG
ncbi:MAG TPA: hypothetical protein VK327_18885 [Candidatus Paceibacterota bacterium]|nr:hypothetical protein [Candidatus Paceibacterota bacterium]